LVNGLLPLNGCSQMVNADVAEELARHERTESEQDEADEQPGRALGGNVEHGHEQAEEQGGGAHVGLEDQDDEAGPPRDEHRAEVAGPGQVDAQHPPPGQGQHVPLADQVAGEEHGQAQLGEAAQDDPVLGPVHLADRRGQQGRDDQQHQADGTKGVGVALQGPGLADQGEHGHEGRDADGAPDHLEGRGRRAHRADDVARVPGPPGLLQPVDHHDAEAVQQGGQRQHQRVRPRRQPADGQVGDAHDDRERQAVGEHPGRDLAVQPEADRGVREHDHGHREDEHAELGAAPPARHGHHARDSRGCGDRAEGCRLARRGGHRTHEDPPLAGVGAGGQSGGMVGMAGLGMTLPLLFFLTGRFCQVRRAW
jgi:hypothetical protein